VLLEVCVQGIKGGEIILFRVIVAKKGFRKDYGYVRKKSEV
jgi:hypothetical protein